MEEQSNEALWYVVHTYSGYENKVANDLQTMVENRRLQDLICDIKVPTEMVPEIKDGKERMVEHKLFPGYVLVKMVMNDDTWYVVRNTRGCTGFVGPASKPVPLTAEEVEKMGVEKAAPLTVDFKVGARLRPMDAWTAAPEAEMVNRIDHEGLLMLMFTSGTTGRSKGVMLSEKNYFTACQMYIDGLKSVLDYEERLVPQYLDQTFSHFTLVPMFHLAGFICYFVYGIQGWTLNLCCDARDLRRDMSLMHSDAMSTPPVLVEMICNEVKRGHADRLNGLWNLSCSSAILDPAILSDLVKNGFYINQCYSMTELAGYGLLNVTQEGDHLRALGKPDGFCEVKVDETGEICVRGGCVMLGYYKDPEATAGTIDKDGWLHTGDLARVDEEGYYYMTGRKKNLIILDSGENVSPEELEKLLGKCDAIKECIVKEMGKKIGTVVCCEDDKQQQVKAFVTELNRTLPMYKRISVVECSAEPLPRNALGKLLRK